MNTLTPTLLADYFINNDLELQVIRGDMLVLAEHVNLDFPDAICTFGLLTDAVHLAMLDPYMQQMARFYDQGSPQDGGPTTQENK